MAETNGVCARHASSQHAQQPRQPATIPPQEPRQRPSNPIVAAPASLLDSPKPDTSPLPPPSHEPQPRSSARRPRRQQVPSASSNTVPAKAPSAFDEAVRHRWGCGYLIIALDGSRAEVDEALYRASDLVMECSFPVVYEDLSRRDDIASLVDLGLRATPIPQSLFELIILSSSYQTHKTSIEFERLRCERRQIKLSTFRNRHSLAEHYREARHLDEQREFRVYANQLIVGIVLSIIKTERFPRGDLCVGAWLRVADEVLEHIRETAEREASAHSSIAKLKKMTKIRAPEPREDYRKMFLYTLCLEYQTCPSNKPGFQLYRVTTDFTESSSLTQHEISYGASLFGGWFFDGPLLGTSKPACVIAYLFGGGNHWNYYIVRIPDEDLIRAATYGDDRVRLSTLNLPALPLSLQLFGFEGGFHPRMAKTQIAGISTLSRAEAVRFMRRHHVCYLPSEDSRDIQDMLTTIGFDPCSERARPPMASPEASQDSP